MDSNGFVARVLIMVALTGFTFLVKVGLWSIRCLLIGQVFAFDDEFGKVSRLLKSHWGGRVIGTISLKV